MNIHLATQIFVQEMQRMASSLNCSTLSLKKAREYASDAFEDEGKSIDDTLPDFDKNYMLLQSKCKKALNIPRVNMPVIEPDDMGLFYKRLQEGKIDIFAPYAKGKFHVPRNMTKEEAEEWVELGYKDNVIPEDKIRGKITKLSVKKLLPTQSQIWLEKIIKNIIRFGRPGPSSPILKAPVIVSKEGYILDGHHRFGQAMITDPKLELQALYIPLDINMLLAVGNGYSEAIGNKKKAKKMNRIAVIDREVDRAMFDLLVQFERIVGEDKLKRVFESNDRKTIVYNIQNQLVYALTAMASDVVATKNEKLGPNFTHRYPRLPRPKISKSSLMKFYAITDDRKWTYARKAMMNWVKNKYNSTLDRSLVI